MNNLQANETKRDREANEGGLRKEFIGGGGEL